MKNSTREERQLWLDELSEQNMIDSVTETDKIFRRKFKRDHYKEIDREIRRLQTEYDNFWNEDHYFWEKLPKPIFIRYKKFFTVRKELSASKDFPVLKTLCAITTTPVYSRRKDFFEKTNHARKRKVLFPGHTYVREWDYKKLGDEVKKELTGVPRLTYYGGEFICYYPERIWRWDEVKTVPIFATYRGIPNSKLFSRREEVSWLLHNKHSRYSKRLYKNSRWKSYRDRFWLKSDRDKTRANDVMRVQLQEYYYESDNPQEAA